MDKIAGSHRLARSDKTIDGRAKEVDMAKNHTP
jgi:hypothetical protein